MKIKGDVVIEVKGGVVTIKAIRQSKAAKKSWKLHRKKMLANR